MKTNIRSDDFGRKDVIAALFLLCGYLDNQQEGKVIYLTQFFGAGGSDED